MADRRPLFRDHVTGQVTEIDVAFNDTVPSNGEVLIWDETQQAYVPGDPYVQGVFPPGTNVDTANGGSPPQPLNPVLIGARDPNGLLRDLNEDDNGNLLVADAAAEESLATLASTVQNTGSPAEPTLQVFVTNPTSAEIAPIASTALAPGLVPVATSSVQVLAANASRKGCNLTNMSDSTISLAFGGNAAVLFYGIVLGPGGVFWMDLQDFTTESVNAIASGTDGTLAVQEFD